MSKEFIIEQSHGIYTIDTGFQRPGLVASHLVVDNGHACFVDVGTATGLDRLLDTLDVLNINRDAVEAVIVTHVHLDHAGCAGSLMQSLPNARLIVHPRGARHMIDPAKLVAGATAVYGEEQMRTLFGEILPIDAARVIEAGDEFEYRLGQRSLLFLDTPGHARHHFCVYDEKSAGFFTGDTFGLSYREFDTLKGAFIVPTTTPVQFDPEAFHASIDRLMSFEPDYMYLTHFGRVTDPADLAQQLHEQIEEYVRLAVSVRDDDNRQSLLAERMLESLLDRLEKHGCRLPESKARELMQMDVDLNTQGLLWWLEHDYPKQQGRQ